MSNLRFCIQRLLEAAEFATAGNFRGNVEPLVRQLLKTRLSEAKDRVALKEWAETELGKLEVVQSGGMSKLVPTHRLAETSRKMALFQTVINVLDNDVTTAG